MFDNAAVVTLISLAVLGLAYFTYGKYLARKVFQLDPNRPTPAHELEDGVDFVPTGVPVLFGHHFASIAGLGPILGPAIAVIWGWVPAVLWVIFGSIFVGAIHDLGALAVSLRFKGRSIGDVSKQLIGPRARLLFLIIIFFLMSLAMGAFVNAISSLFVLFRPDAIVPSLGLMIVAIAVGIAVYKFKFSLGPVTALGLLAFGGLIALGVEVPVPTYRWHLEEKTSAALSQAQAADSEDFPAPYGAAAAMNLLEKQGNTAGVQEVDAAVKLSKRYWIYALLLYGFVASVLPVWLLLQPRDYINSFQLYAALLLMAGGLVVAAVTGAAPNQINAEPIRTVSDAPPMFPFLLVTIACGAVSGFHSLVSSGTTVRQINRETDALPVGFGAMLTEGALAILVIMACVAGLGAGAWADGGLYSSFGGIGGSNLGTQLTAVVHGGAAFLEQVGVPSQYAQAFLAVTITAFALTTLDSATRLLRFNVEEILNSVGLQMLANRYVASFVAVLGIAFFGLSTSGTSLWILFGTTNQLLAGLTLLTVSLFLFKLGRRIEFTVIPMVLMFAVSIGAMLMKLSNDLDAEVKNWQLIWTTIVVLAMTFWLIVEAIISFSRGREGLDLEPGPASPVDEDVDEAVAASELG